MHDVTRAVSIFAPIKIINYYTSQLSSSLNNDFSVRNNPDIPFSYSVNCTNTESQLYSLKGFFGNLRFCGGSKFLDSVLWTSKGSSGLTRSKWFLKWFFVIAYLLQGFFQLLSKNKTTTSMDIYHVL